MRRALSRKRWTVIFLAVLAAWAAYWPYPRLELSSRGLRSPLYLALPNRHQFRVVYRDMKTGKTENRRFRILRDGKILFFETDYLYPAPALASTFPPEDVSHRKGILIVRVHCAPVPALHFALTPGQERILWLGGHRKVDLNSRFPENSLVTLRVIHKPLLFFLWQTSRFH